MEEYQQVREDETSLRDYIIKGRDYFREVLRYWYIPAALALLGAAYQVYKYNQHVPLYTATITFMVDEDEGGGSSALTGMLSQFGLGSVRPARYNFDKIMELSKSRRVVQKTLFSRVPIDGKDDFLANHIIRIYDFNSGAGEGDADSAFFFTHDSLPGFSRRENEVLISLYHFIIGPPDQPQLALLSADYNEDSNIMSLSASTKNERLSLELSSHMFKALSDYYINKAIEKAQKTFRIVSAKRDSVLAELRSKEYQLANFIDRNRGFLLRTENITQNRLAREISGLTAMYVEVLKNAEMADFSLRSKTPFIQVVDHPIPPIQPSSVSLIRKILIGLIIGGAIGVVFIVARRMLRDVMAG